MHLKVMCNLQIFSTLDFASGLYNTKTKLSLICEMLFSPELSQAVVDAGAVPLLVLCIQEPEMPLKRIAASALSDICKHSPEVGIFACLFHT